MPLPGWARALATEPSVLLSDEPFGGLVGKVREGLRAWLRGLRGNPVVAAFLGAGVA